MQQYHISIQRVTSRQVQLELYW